MILREIIFTDKVGGGRLYVLQARLKHYDPGVQI